MNKQEENGWNMFLDRIFYEWEEDYEDEEEDKKFFGRKSKVVPMTQQSQAIKMVISQPTTFEQSEEICSLLKEKKSVIVNLEYVSKEVARRIVDFISGGVYALDGHIQKISNSIFLIASVLKVEINPIKWFGLYIGFPSTK